MCGIAGILSTNKNIVNKHSLKKMANALSHRGPDGEGFWINAENNIGLAHRRLAIIDLSENAAQPMHFADRYSITFNGEIYNYKELKKLLQSKGYTFKSESDTEVILAAYDFYKNNCVQYFDGMFAFAIWDEVEQMLFCARDIFGEKPFYYFFEKNVFAFASEMKALWNIGINKNADEKMMVNYLALGHVQNATNKSQTFFKDIFSLPPAHVGMFTLQNLHFKIYKYKDVDKKTTLKISENDAIEKINNLLTTSISMRLRSDVPIGSSLSGGIDSSTIAYLIKEQNKNSFKTFSAIFPGFEKDESLFIQELSQSLSIQNFGTTPNELGLIKDFEKLCYHQEEPFTSSSIYAQYKVFELAKNHNIKVLLDGQGADEVFGGYTKYIHWYLQELINCNKFAKFKNEFGAFAKNKIDIKFGLKNIAATYMPAHAAVALEKNEANKILKNNNLSAEIRQLVKGNETEGIYKPVVTMLNDILYYNTMQYGLEELLRYADRNSMAHGVEVRLPFLNYELVQFIFSLPPFFKISNGFTKSILRKTMQNKLPNSILWNPIKTGFEPPQKIWMQSKIVQEYIYNAKELLVSEKILNAKVLQQKINATNAHQIDNADWRYLNLAAALKINNYYT